MNYTVHTIDLNFKGRPNGIAAFLIESDHGPVLVETGPHSTYSHLVSGIRQCGFEPEDVKTVLLSHIHLDHAGAAWCMAQTGATIYLHPFGYRHMHDPSKLLASAKMIYKEEMDTLWGDLQAISAEKLIKVNDLQSLEIGNLRFIPWHTPGHAKHHIAWQLGSDLFTGDVAGVCIHDGPVLPPCPPPDIHIGDWLASLERIAAIGEVNKYYLTHFGAVTDLARHREKLKTGLLEYADFFLPHYKAGATVAEVLPYFREFVKSFLVKNGMKAEDAAAYEAANPSDMSAGGLMRYWQKQDEAGLI